MSHPNTRQSIDVFWLRTWKVDSSDFNPVVEGFAVEIQTHVQFHSSQRYFAVCCGSIYLPQLRYHVAAYLFNLFDVVLK